MSSKMVDREVIKPVKLRENGKFKDYAVGEIVSVTEQNAEIFTDRLAAVGFAKTAAGRKSKIETEHAAQKIEIEELNKQLEVMKQNNVALHTENVALKAAKA